MLRTLNTTLLAFLLAIATSMVIVLFTPVSLHNRLLLTVVFVAPIWLGIALWVTQKNNMKRVFIYELVVLVLLSILVGLGLYFGE